jgi:hypothetical protein
METAMADTARNVTNNSDRDLGLPDGTLVPKGRTVRIENWPAVEGNQVVKSWLVAKALTVEAAGKQSEGEKEPDPVLRSLELGVDLKPEGEQTEEEKEAIREAELESKKQAELLDSAARDLGDPAALTETGRAPPPAARSVEDGAAEKASAEARTGEAKARRGRAKSGE